jgi:GT2 family glycosyltransferase
VSVSATPLVTVVIPNWNGRQWLEPCLAALAAGTVAPAEVILVDNGSQDGSLDYVRLEHPDVRLAALDRNTGFAHAANCGLRLASHEFVGLINTDVVVAVDYDAGDVLRRDGACEQRGRFGSDDGRWDEPGEVFGACAGAALYRRSAVLALGGFDELYFAYLEDVDLALRLALSGWRCRYEPAVALHAGESSSKRLPGGHQALVTRNTVLLVAKAFPISWLPFVAYRQLGWAWHAALERRLGAHVRGLLRAVPLLAPALRARRALRRSSAIPIEEVVPARPFRGPRAGGHPAGRR